MDTLGYLYYDLVMDYARAAYWWQKFAETGGSVDKLKIVRCYHEGNLTVKVTIKNAKIESVEVTQQNETPNRYVMAEPITRKIVSKQGFDEVDAVTGATETSDAIINAVAKAIVSAMK